MAVPYRPVQAYDVLCIGQALQGACPACLKLLVWEQLTEDREAIYIADCCCKRWRLVPHTVQVKVEDLSQEKANA